MKLGLINPLSPSETNRLRPLQKIENQCEKTFNRKAPSLGLLFKLGDSEGFGGFG